jgi:hypothetical protein
MMDFQDNRSQGPGISKKYADSGFLNLMAAANVLTVQERTK